MWKLLNHSAKRGMRGHLIIFSKFMVTDMKITFGLLVLCGADQKTRAQTLVLDGQDSLG